MWHMLRVPTARVFAYYTNRILTTINSDTTVPSEKVVYDKAVTEHTVLAEMKLFLSAHDGSTSTVAANELRPGCDLLLPLPDQFSQYVQDICAYKIA